MDANRTGTNQRTVDAASDVTYTPATPTNWRPTVPSLVSQALDILASIVVNVRVWLDASIATIYVDNNAGSDTTGTGTNGNPYASLDWALTKRGQMPTQAVIVAIILKTTGVDYTIGSGIKVTSYTRVTSAGQAVQSNRGFVDAGSSTDVGIIVTIDGVAPGNDALIGQWVLWTDGALAGQYGKVHKNVGATVYVSSSDLSGAFTNPTAGGGAHLQLVAPPARIALSANLSIEETFGLSFWDLNVDGGGNNIIFTATNYVVFNRCYLTNVTTMVVAAGGSLALQTTLLQGLGGTGGSSGATPGLLLIRPGGTVLVEGGAVVYGDPGATTGRFVANYGTFTVQGEAICRQLNGSLKGVYTQMGRVVGNGTNEVAGEGSNVMRFEDCDGALFSFNSTAGGANAGEGGIADLPRLTNTGGGHATSGAYVVTAQRGANVQLNGGTAQGSGAALAVSADNSATNTCSNIDGTVIRGGSPTGAYSAAAAFPGFASPQTAPGETTVYGSFNLKNDANNDASVDCLVETGIGTGGYTRVQTVGISHPSVPANPYTLAYSFYCPAGRRFQFVANVGGGATAASSVYNTLVK